MARGVAGGHGCESALPLSRGGTTATSLPARWLKSMRRGGARPKTKASKFVGEGTHNWAGSNVYAYTVLKPRRAQPWRAAVRCVSPTSASVDQGRETNTNL